MVRSLAELGGSTRNALYVMRHGLGWPCAGLTAPALIVATTSTQDTSLLDVLISVFERLTGCAVKTTAVGPGAALAMGEHGGRTIRVGRRTWDALQFLADGKEPELDAPPDENVQKQPPIPPYVRGRREDKKSRRRRNRLLKAELDHSNRKSKT